MRKDHEKHRGRIKKKKAREEIERGIEGRGRWRIWK